MSLTTTRTLRPGWRRPAAAARSPGTLALAAALESARDEGLSELDLLRGREPYKYRWGAEDRLHFARRLEASPAPHARHPEAAATGPG